LQQEIQKSESLTLALELQKLTQVKHGQRRFIEHPPLVFHPAPADPLAEEMLSVFHKYRQSLRDDLRVLLARFHVVDTVMKVVGIGSVGTRCGVALLVAGYNEPLFLQIKEALPSVLEPYVGKSSYENHGQRVVIGQHLMQAASDIFLGWTSSTSGRDYYLRQLRDLKTSIEIDGMAGDDLIGYSALCGWALARAHARSGDRILISGYLGQKNIFDEAITSFAVAYANQTEQDYEKLLTAVKSGEINVAHES